MFYPYYHVVLLCTDHGELLWKICTMVFTPLFCVCECIEKKYFFHLQVGRSGRFGHLGLAVNLITYEDRFNLYATFCETAISFFLSPLFLA
jgi:hypothetical protein